MFPLQLLLLAATPALAMPVDGNGSPAVESTKRAPAVKAPVSTSLYNDIVYYTAFAGTAVKPCEKLPGGVEQLNYINNTVTDTQAALFQVDSREEFVLGIPGTVSDQDARTDFRFFPKVYDSAGNTCSGCKVHEGFLEAWNSIQADVETAIKAALASKPNYNVVIAGHSLGGAIAHLAFGTLKPQQPLKIAKLFTYGSPRVGDPKFADYIDTLAGATELDEGVAHRVTHFNDPVPRLPPTEFLFFFEYRHPRTEYWQSTMNVTQAETFRCYGQEPADCLFSINPAFNTEAHGTYPGLQGFCRTN